MSFPWPLRTLASIVLFASLLGCSAKNAKPDDKKPLGPDELRQVEQSAVESYSKREWLAAAIAYRRLTIAVPGDPDFWFRLGTAEARLGNSDRALAAYREAVVRDPKMSKGWYNLSVVEIRRAQNALTQLIRFAPDNDDNAARAASLLEALSELIGPLPAPGVAGPPG
ncbi:MAG: tetratricopeptide repeat protein [Pseudomonadota bacterium]